MERAFRCYAHGGGTEWRALCVDLDIAVQGASFEEVRSSLATAIEMYLETVAELPAEERPAFLSRRSPWHVRTGFAAMARFHGFFGGRRRRGFAIRPRAPAAA